MAEAYKAVIICQLTNAQVVYEALAKVEGDFADRPDEIYMVTTISDNPWWVHALRVDVTDYYTLSQAGQCMTELDPSQLEDLMSKLRAAREAAA